MEVRDSNRTKELGLEKQNATIGIGTLLRLKLLLELTLKLRLSTIKDRELVARADVNIDEKKDSDASV